MPELPEVETTVRAINKFENSTLKKVIIHNRNLRWKVDKKVTSLTKNKLIHKISRRAKYILIYLDDNCLMIHLGMSGKLRIQNRQDNYFKKHDHAEFIFEDEKIVFNDTRRFGSIHLSKDPANHRLIKNLASSLYQIVLTNLTWQIFAKKVIYVLKNLSWTKKI